MLTLPVASGEFNDHVAGEFVANVPVEPATATLVPRNCIACVASLVCCNEISVCRLVFISTCCCTEVNSTNCWVNWLVSSGSSGSWFCNCVVNSVRNELKLSASSFSPELLLTPLLPLAVLPLALELAMAADVGDVLVGFVVVMIGPQRRW